jgi:hypothetical protein
MPDFQRIHQFDVARHHGYWGMPILSPPRREFDADGIVRFRVRQDEEIWGQQTGWNPSLLVFNRVVSFPLLAGTSSKLVGVRLPVKGTT